MLGRPLAWLLAPALATALVTLTAPGDARAQSVCDAGAEPTPDFRETDNFPASSESDVPIDGLVRIRFGNRVPPRPFIRVRQHVEHDGDAGSDAGAGVGEEVPGETNVLANELHWHAQSPLSPNTTYDVEYTELTGTNTFLFVTGSVHSVDWATAAGAAPGDGSTGGFEGLVPDDPNNIKFEKAGATDECGDPEAIRITVSWHNPPNTHWPVGDIEFVIYETRGPGIAGPVERGRARGRVRTNDCADGYEQCTSFRLTPANASGPVCFNLQALDPYGRADGNANERCIDPSVGPYFQGCEAAPPRGEVAGSRGWMALLAVGALAVVTAVGVRGRRPRA